LHSVVNPFAGFTAYPPDGYVALAANLDVGIPLGGNKKLFIIYDFFHTKSTGIFVLDNQLLIPIF
jgi:hypothetical protein